MRLATFVTIGSHIGLRDLFFSNSASIHRTSLDKERIFCVPPFALCTYELFERYAEAMLRKVHGPLWVGYNEKENNLPGSRYWVRPDFIVRDRGIVIDCKYKFYPGVVDERERGDVYQVVAYSRHLGVLTCIGAPQGPKSSGTIGSAVPRSRPRSVALGAPASDECAGPQL